MGLEATAGGKVVAAAAAAVVRVVAMVVVALSVAARAATVAVVAVAEMDAAGVAAATLSLSSREVGVGEAGLAVVLAAASCASAAEAALRCCCVAVMVGWVLEVASLRWRPLMRLDAASGQKQLPREGCRQAASLRRRPVLLPCVEAVAEALSTRPRTRKNIVVPTMIDPSEVVPRRFRRRNVLAPMLERFRATGRSTANMVATRHRQGPVASAGCS